MQSDRRLLRRALALLAVLALVLVACGEETEPEGDEGGQEAAKDATMIFGTSADPVALDGALV